jgi:hypothetical protein
MNCSSMTPGCLASRQARQLVAPALSCEANISGFGSLVHRQPVPRVLPLSALGQRAGNLRRGPWHCPGALPRAEGQKAWRCAVRRLLQPSGRDPGVGAQSSDLSRPSAVSSAPAPSRAQKRPVTRSSLASTWSAGRVSTPLHFQSIAHLGACRKARVVPHNRRPRQNPGR